MPGVACHVVVERSMRVIWLNGTVGCGKSAVGQALAGVLPRAHYLDGDDCAGPAGLPAPRRWRIAMDRLIAACIRPAGRASLVVAYPLRPADHARVRAACGRARVALHVVTLAPPLAITLRGRGVGRAGDGRVLSPAERRRVREMRAQGYHRRRFAALSLANATPPPGRTARRIAAWLAAGLCADRLSICGGSGCHAPGAACSR